MKNLKNLFPYLKRYKNKIILGFVFVTISNFASTYIPRIVGRTVDEIGKKGFTMEAVLWNVAFILALTVVSGTFMFLTRRTIIVASREIEYDLRSDLIYSMQLQSMNFFHRNSTGSLMAHATNDIPAAREFLGPAIMYSANTVSTFVFSLYFMFSLSPDITLIGLIPMPFLAYSTYVLGKKIHVAFRDVQAQYADLTTQAQESFSGARVIRAYVREKYESFRFKNLSNLYLRKNLRLARYDSSFMPFMMVLVGLSQVTVLAYGGWKVIGGTATLGDLVQYFIYLELLIWPVAAIGWVTNLIQRGAASAGRLAKLMDSVPEIVDSQNAGNFKENVEGHIKFDNISLSYNGSGINALENINISLEKGKSLGIVGPVGSGKSSLIHLLPRLFEPTEGKIYFDKTEIRDIPTRKIRDSIGMVAQDTFLFSATIEENIKFGNPNAADEQVIEAAQIAALHEEVLTFDNGYDTMLGERGITLSGGQKQRTALARAILRNPKILVLDDSLSAVDTNTEDKVLRALRKFMSGRTTIIISHRISTVKDCDNIIVLSDGKIIESGNHEQLVALGGHYAELFKMQQLKEEIEIM